MADEHAAQGEEGLVDVGAPLVAHAQATKAVEPGEGALDYPAVGAKTLRTVLPAPGDAGDDPTRSQRRPAASVVVALVGVQLLGPVAWPSTWSGDGWHRVDGFFQHPGVMHVGGREHRR